jgi:hypothetical protein
MSRKFVVLAAVLAAVIFASHPAGAQQRKPINPTIDATNFWVGGAWTAVFFGINHFDAKWNTAHAGMTALSAGVLTTGGCVATAPMVASAVLARPLTYREAYMLVGSCVIPIVGGWLVNEAFNNGWMWAPDEKPVRVAHHGKKKMAAATPAATTAAAAPAATTGAATPATTAAAAKPATTPALAKPKVAAVKKAEKIAAAMPVDSLIAAH